MQKNYLKHLEILKTVPAIKESIEELKCHCTLKSNAGIWYLYLGANTILELGNNIIMKVTKQELLKNFNVISKVHEGHLRMFLYNKLGKNFTIKTLWNGQTRIQEDAEFGKYYWVQLDERYPYHEQSENFFGKLNEWLIKEFDIKL